MGGCYFVMPAGEAKRGFEKWRLRKIRADRVVLSPSPGLRSAYPADHALPLLEGGTKSS